MIIWLSILLIQMKYSLRNSCYFNSGHLFRSMISLEINSTVSHGLFKVRPNYFSFHPLKIFYGNTTILGCVTIRQGFGLDNGIYWHLMHSLLTTSITALSLIYTLYKSLGDLKFSQSSLVVSWQRMYNSLTVTAEHYEVFFAQPISFLAISSELFWKLSTPETLNSRLTAHLELRNSTDYLSQKSHCDWRSVSQ
jgi:hypothetical protein